MLFDKAQVLFVNLKGLAGMLEDLWTVLFPFHDIDDYLGHADHRDAVKTSIYHIFNVIIIKYNRVKLNRKYYLELHEGGNIYIYRRQALFRFIGQIPFLASFLGLVSQDPP